MESWLVVSNVLSLVFFVCLAVELKVLASFIGLISFLELIVELFYNNNFSLIIFLFKDWVLCFGVYSFCSLGSSMITGPNFDKLLYILSSLLSLTLSFYDFYPFYLSFYKPKGNIFFKLDYLMVFVDLDRYIFSISFCFLFSNTDELLMKVP